MDLRQSGAMKLLFPRPATDALEAIVINTAGGVTGGDRFSLLASVNAGARLCVTTQACERVYRAQSGQTAVIENTLAVADGARLDWLPQETILFDGCALRRRMVADLAGDATLLFVEPLVFGRALMGETLGDAMFADRVEIRRDGVPIFLDAVKFSGGVTAHLGDPNIADGAGAMALVVLSGPNAARHLTMLRALLPATGGATALAESLLVARILAVDSFDLRRALIPILHALNNDTLPRSWMT